MHQGEKWALIHRYREAAYDDLVPAILCPDDDEECVPILGPDGDPALRCIYCNSVFKIGTLVFDQMKKNLKGLNE